MAIRGDTTLEWYLEVIVMDVEYFGKQYRIRKLLGGRMVLLFVQSRGIK